jgi:excisionase family DNA binding protein
MTNKELRAMIQKRIDDLDRLNDDPESDPEKIVANERAILHEVAGKMARAGFPRLLTAAHKLHDRDNPEIVKTFLSRCLKALRRRQPTPANDDMLTPPAVAKLYGVSADTVRAWIVSGELLAVNVAKAKRPRYRISKDALNKFDAKNLPPVVPAQPVRRRSRKKTDLLVNRY